MKSSRRIKIIGSAAGLFLAGGLTVGLSSPASAQAAPFLDTPTNHWAYEAVQDLAKKGIVIGYPDGTYGGKRPMTRYEFAVAIDRLLRTLGDMNSQNPPPGTPAPSSLTQDELNQIQALIDKFRPELDTIQANLQTAQDNIDALRADVLDAKALAGKAQDTANNSYGVGADRKFQISGYIQARFQSADGYGKGSQDRFPQGVSSKAGSYNGNYAQGGNVDSAELRRSRLKFTGQITGNTRYGVQIDASGAVTAGAKSQSAGDGARGLYRLHARRRQRGQEPHNHSRRVRQPLRLRAAGVHVELPDPGAASGIQRRQLRPVQLAGLRQGSSNRLQHAPAAFVSAGRPEVHSGRSQRRRPHR